MKRLLLLFLALLLLSGRSLHAADLVLAQEGKTDYQIVIPDQLATPALTDSLRQIGRLVQTAFQANGVETAVVTESQRDKSKPGIYLGNTAFAKANGVDVAKIRNWGYVHRVVGRDLIVTGRDVPSPETNSKDTRRPVFDRIGTAKGVADFLREYMGVRFLYPDLAPYTQVGKADKIDLLNTPAIEFMKTTVVAVPSDLNKQHTPPIDWHTAHPAGASFYDIANNRYPRVDEVFGGHTYERAIPVEKYREEHPEYFALIGGQRSGIKGSGVTQYCISNPTVQELIYQDMIGWLDRGYQSVDLGQPDGFRPCQCKDCDKLYGTGSDWNEKLWIFHRNLAERVLKARPGKQVTMMSYIQTELPPKTFDKFPDNTAILLTGTNEEDIAPWRECEVPRGFSSYIYNWCPNMATRYTPMRTPGFVEAQAKRLVKNRFQSIYRDGAGALFGLEGPVYYVMGRMYDDAEKNQAKDLMHEFCLASFGKTAPSMLQFYDQLYHAIELYARHLGTRDDAWTYQNIYGQRRKHISDPFQFLGFLYTPSLLESLESQLAQAEKTANAPKIKQRLALVRREFDYLKHLVRVVHLYHGFQIQPDRPSRDRLLDAIDARNIVVDSYYGARGNALPTGDWAYTFFPPIGHDAHHLRLAYNGYQEPFANTAMNWDTKAMRNAPLPGAKRMNVISTERAVTIDGEAWKSVKAELVANLPAGAQPAGKTEVKTLFDKTNLYVRIEAAMAESASAGDTKPPATRDALSIYLAPPNGREIAYRFTVEPRKDAKDDAANGIVTDPIDPRYGKFDPDWNGAWDYTFQVDSQGQRWVALVTIPFKTIDATAPTSETSWRGNFTRHCVTGVTVQSAIWSAAHSSKALDDRNDFGELVFTAVATSQAPSAAKKDSLTELREGLYKSSYNLPDDWKSLPDRLPTKFTSWQFRADPLDQGLKEQWNLKAWDKSDCLTMSVPSFWAENEQVGQYVGNAWYRTTFEVPESLKGRKIRLGFGGIDEQAWVYINGKLVGEHTEGSTKMVYGLLWDEPFTVDIPAELIKPGAANEVTVRVHNKVANGGIWRTVIGYALPGK